MFVVEMIFGVVLAVSVFSNGISAFMNYQPQNNPLAYSQEINNYERALATREVAQEPLEAYLEDKSKREERKEEAEILSSEINNEDYYNGYY